jgi:hypothetical protein
MSTVDYQRRANQHKPSDPAALALEVRRLRANGLTAYDIAGALRLGLPAVEQMLRTPSPVEGDPYHGLDLPTLRKKS